MTLLDFSYCCLLKSCFLCISTCVYLFFCFRLYTI